MRAILMTAAALTPWVAFVGMLYGLSAVLEEKRAGRNILCCLLAVDAISCAGLILGPYVLRQFGLEFRCWPRMLLIVVVFLSGCCTILGIIILFFRRKQRDWLERGGVLLSGVILLGMSLYCSVVLSVLTLQSEEVGHWNGKTVVMVTVEGIGFRCYTYHGPLVMGEYLGTILSE